MLNDDGMRIGRRWAYAALALVAIPLNPATAAQSTLPSFSEYLQKSVVSHQDVDAFLRGNQWATFDSELGYVLGNSMMPWGIDHSTTIETINAIGARTTLLYNERKARINTYGDSYTESQQVNDAETWQEYLAGHLGEPVRNFGVGGYGFYQAYRRMLREESTAHGAPYIVLTLCCDDSTRSLYRSRWTVIYPGFRREAERLNLFHANPWANLEMNLDTGRFQEKPQLLSTQQSLYRMTEPQWMAENLQDDLAAQLSAYIHGRIRTLDRDKIGRLAARLDFNFDWSLSTLSAEPATPTSRRSSFSPMQTQAQRLLDRYSSRATHYILAKARAFAAEHGRKLLVVLNDPYRALEGMAASGSRFDQEVVDYLRQENFEYFDVNEAHLREMHELKLGYQEYIGRYMVGGLGHYNPKGNHFVAYALKDKLVRWLDPLPLPYGRQETQAVDFKDYLKGSR